MSDIHHLEINLDLKQNLNVYANCKQLDILHLIFNIFDDGVQADLSDYNVRLKAMKSDNVPLIQDTQYTVVDNVVTIIAHEQLTTTSGITKIELQFMNKTTGEKKATFNLNLKVIASTLEAERSISTATYTLLEELENKMDQALDLTENMDEAIEINNTLSTTVTDATNSKSALEIDIATGNTLKTELITKITDANIINMTLESSITAGNQLKTDIDAENVRTESNIKVMESFGDATELVQNVTLLKTEIENARGTDVDLDARLDKSDTQLSEIVKDTTRTTTSKTVTGAINELNTNKAPISSPHFTGTLTIDGGIIMSTNTVLEIGSYIDFHNNGSASDFDYRIQQSAGRLYGAPLGGSTAKILESRDIVNNLGATVAGFPLDATQGKAINDRISNRNDFVYTTSVNSADLNTFKGAEYHLFSMNSVNAPIANGHGFLDVSFFNGGGFSPAIAGVTIQKYHKYDTGQQYTRTYNHTTGVWSTWIIG